MSHNSSRLFWSKLHLSGIEVGDILQQCYNILSSITNVQGTTKYSFQTRTVRSLRGYARIHKKSFLEIDNLRVSSSQR